MLAAISPSSQFHVQENNGLVLGSLAEAHVRSLGQVFSRLLRTSVLSAIRALAGVFVCVQRDDGVRGERGSRKLLVEAARQVCRQMCIRLQVLRQSWERGLGILGAGHGGQTRPRGTAERVEVC